MDKLLDTYYLPNLNQKDPKKLNKSISSKNEAVIKILSTKKSPDTDGVTAKFSQTCKE